MCKKSFKLEVFMALIGFVVLIISCEKELFVDDISNRKVALISPGNGSTLESNTVNFSWEPIEDALMYNFQLCTPNFTTVSELLYDLDTVSSQLTLNLTPGVYEWRVSATNGGYQTHFTTYRLTIDSTENLSVSQVVLTSPIDSFFTNTIFSSFSWENLINTTEYNFRIVKGNDLESSELFTSETGTKSNSIVLAKTLENGFYVWGVNAENASSKTAFSKRFFWYDNISPMRPVQTSPADNNTVQGGKLEFKWETNTDEGSPIYDTLHVFSDSQLSTVVYKVNSNAGTYADSLAVGTYYWRISRGDKCGNFGGYSITRSVQIQ